MRPVTPRFLASLRSPHLVVARCKLYFPGNPTPITVNVEAGSVTIDRTAQARRRATIQIPWSLSLGESYGVDLRALPLGGYATLERGLRYPDGTIEYAMLGYLRVESVSWATLARSASLELSDRMAQVNDEQFTSPFAAGGMRPADAAIAIVTQVFGSSITYSKPWDPAITMQDVFYSGERSAALTDLEQSASAETYFDAAGNFVFASKTPGTSVWSVDTGADGVMIDASENLDRTGIYNGVLVQGQPDATQAPVSGLAVDDDPSSPTLWGGPFGKVALLADSTSVQDNTQALAAAQSLLGLRLKMTRSLTLISAPNPALEAGDIITVTFDDGRVEEHMIDSVIVDLAGAAQTITTRSNYLPAAAPDMAPTRGFVGVDAWRELADAEVVTA